MNQLQTSDVEKAITRFASWLAGFGEVSHDHQSYFAGYLGRQAKALYYKKPLLGTLAVAPMIFSEAFVPSARGLFYKRLRFPIADAHYAMGFAFLAEAYGKEAYLKRAIHFLNVLKETRSPGYKNYCWGYPFNWETRTGTYQEGTPMITSVPYMYEAFRQVFQLDGDPQWRGVMRSIADHALEDYQDFEVSPTASTCTYAPGKENTRGVINANAYRSFLLTQASIDFSDERYAKVAARNLNFVLESQNPNGSWYYSTDNVRDFVDHFHTCFVLKALAKIERIKSSPECRGAIERGVKYYTKNLFEENGLPKPFSKAPRMTVYRRELYDCAECINVCILLRERFPETGQIAARVISDILQRWQKSDGSFRARELLIGWDNVPMHRWAQSQMFRSLSSYVAQELRSSQAKDSESIALSGASKSNS
jgi:hypothetical protein